MNLKSLLRRSFATASILTVIGLSTAFGQERSANDYLVTGYGTDLVRSEDNNPIQGANIEYKMTETSGDSIFEPVNHQTNEQGIINYTNLPLHYEMYVGMPEVKITQNGTIVFPTPSGISTTVNIKTDEKSGEMELYNGRGQLTDKIEGPVEYENGIAGYFVNCLTDDPDGMYYFRVKTVEGMASGKIIKRGNFQTIYGGIVEIPEEESSDNKASREIPYAIYQKTITAPGFDTLIVQETLYEGDHGTKLYFLEEEGSNIPQHQWITGHTWKFDGTNKTILSGVIVEMYYRATDELIDEDTSNSSGYFEFDAPVSAGTSVYFKAYTNNEDYRCFDGSFSNKLSYEVPAVIESEGDTITQSQHLIIGTAELNIYGGGTATPSSLQIREMFPGDLDIEVGLRGEKQFWLAPPLSSSQKQAYRTNANNFENMMGIQMVESDTELNTDPNYHPYTNPQPVGINVRYGSYNTASYNINVTAPLGNNLNPVFSAETTLSGVNTYIYYHEMYLAIGGSITGNQGISKSNPGAPTNNDKATINFAANYSELLYDEGKAYYTLIGTYDEIQEHPAFPGKEIPISSTDYEKNFTTNGYEFSAYENYNYTNQ